MKDFTTRYGICRPREIAARLAAVRAFCPAFPVALALVAPEAPTAPVAAPAPTVAPLQAEAETFFRFGVEEAPEEIEPAPSVGNPAPFWAVERAAILADAEAITREFEWRRAGCLVSPMADTEELPFIYGFDDLPAEYFALAA
jgi:hypothetical protein